MVTSVLVWVLMVSTNQHSGMVSYSPPVETLQSCQLLQESLSSTWLRERSRCIQIKMVVAATK